MYPTFDEAKALANEGYRRIPVSREMYADRFTPTEVLRVLKHISRHCFILESAEDARQWGRYTFIGFDPTVELTCKGGKLHIRAGADFTETVSHPGDAIRKLLDENRSPKLTGLPPFSGGLVGYFSYSYIGYAEPTLQLTHEDGAFQDVDLMLFDKVIAFDNLRQKIILIAGARADSIDTSYHKAVYELDQLAHLIRSGAKDEPLPPKLKTPLTPQFSRQEYGDMIRKAQHYIHEGDIFQVVLSNPLEAEMDGSLFDVYRVLRTTNPSPYMFYFSSDDIEIAGASPETLAKLTDGKLFTFPLAGTRPRGKTVVEDKALERELLTDAKELAEHNMLVDLGRNDIGRISKLGTVQVEEYLKIERFSHVMHIGSTVTGQILDDKDAVDAVDSILPAGTLSGAPKLRACQIIDELEGRERGIYGGAVGYLDFTGNLDTCIAIRLAYKKNGKVCVRSGAGIVADSIPDNEYQECINKAAAVVRAIETAQEGIDQ